MIFEDLGLSLTSFLFSSSVFGAASVNPYFDLMFSLSNILDSLDSAAKDTLEEEAGPSATWLRSQRKGGSSATIKNNYSEASGSDTAWMSTSSSSAHSGDGLERETEEHALSVLANDGVAATPFAKHSVFHDELKKGLHTISQQDMVVRNIALPPGSAFESAAPAAASSLQDPTTEVGAQSQARRTELAGAKLTHPPVSSTSRTNGPPRHPSQLDAVDEIERLNSECLELEDQVAALKVEVKHAWASYQKAQEQAASREVELQSALQQSGRVQGVQLQAVQAQISGLRTELETAQRALQHAEVAKEEAITALQNSRKEEGSVRGKWAEREAELLAELSSLRTGSAMGVETLRRDLQAALDGAERLRLEHALLISQTQKRHAALEMENTELIATLGERQRESAKVSKPSGDGPSRVETEALEAAQLKAHEMGVALSDEKAKAQELGRQLRAALAEVRLQAAAAEDERTKAETAAVAHARALSALREEVRAGAGDASSANTLPGGALPGAGQLDETRGLQKQVQNLSQQLLRKQQMVLDLQAERGALKSRLQDSEAKAAAAERQHLYPPGSNVAGDEDGDYSGAALEAGLGQPHMARRRGGGDEAWDANNSVKSDLSKYGIKAPARVVGVVDALDSFTVGIARTLRYYPLARVGFAAYFVLLHIWVCFVLAMHTHSLEDGAGGFLVGPGDLVNSKLPPGMLIGRAHLVAPQAQ